MGLQDLLNGEDTDEAAALAQELVFALELFIASHTKQPAK
jgi:hypothetical protein